MLKIMKGSAEQLDKAIPVPNKNLADLTEYFEELIDESSAVQPRTMDLQAPVSSGHQSNDFQIASNLLRALKRAIDKNNSDMEFRIVCDTEEITTLYRVAYNFWFPGTEEDRHPDAHWE